MSDNPDPILKIWWRHWSVVLILAVLAGFVIWGTLNLRPWLRSLQEKMAARSAQRQLENLYRNDKYGGKTPEETFDMFIAALEKGNIELASKYFVLNKQEQWKRTLDEYKTKSLLIDFIKELRDERKNWQKSISSNEISISFEYKVLVSKDSIADFNGQKVNVPAGNYTNEIIFEKNTLANIWKISIL